MAKQKFIPKLNNQFNLIFTTGATELIAKESKDKVVSITRAIAYDCDPKVACSILRQSILN
jgi:hypothetical protein